MPSGDYKYRIHQGYKRIHNLAARLILVRRPQSDSAMPLLCIFHWLPVPHRIEFKFVFTYKTVHGDAPKYLSDLVCPYKPARALRSANNNLLTVVRTHVKAGDNSFVVAAAILRNNINNIKTSACLATFKARLKTHFFLLFSRLSLMFVYFYPYFIKPIYKFIIHMYIYSA